MRQPAMAEVDRAVVPMREVPTMTWLDSRQRVAEPRRLNLPLVARRHVDPVIGIRWPVLVCHHRDDVEMDVRDGLPCRHAVALLDV